MHLPKYIMIFLFQTCQSEQIHSLFHSSLIHMHDLTSWSNYVRIRLFWSYQLYRYLHKPFEHTLPCIQNTTILTIFFTCCKNFICKPQVVSDICKIYRVQANRLYMIKYLKRTKFSCISNKTLYKLKCKSSNLCPL